MVPLHQVKKMKMQGSEAIDFAYDCQKLHLCRAQNFSSNIEILQFPTTTLRHCKGTKSFFFEYPNLSSSFGKESPFKESEIENTWLASIACLKSVGYSDLGQNEKYHFLCFGKNS